MLKQRIITALVVLAVLFAVIAFLPPMAVIGVVAGVILIGAWEWAGFLPTRDWRARSGYVLFIAVLAIGVWWLALTSPPTEWVLWIAVLWWSVALVWILKFPTQVGSTAVAVCGPLVLVPAGLALALLYTSSPNGPALLLFGLMIVWAADVSAYVVGRTLGKHKLAPRVSPAKTWEGVGGGLVGAALMALAGATLFELPLLRMLLLGILVAAFSIVGDLTVSMFKRHAGLKDSGRFFPGHGGVLDRMDSITAAIPLFLLGLSWLGVMA